MKSIILKSIVIFLFLFQNYIFLQAQNTPKSVSNMTKEEILKLSNDDLLALPLDDLLKLASIVGVSVDELVDLSIKSGTKGGFGSQLEDLSIKAYIHGYSDFYFRNIDINRGVDKSTFSLHYFNPMFGINVKDKIIAEIMLEYEHGGSEIAIRYGILDYAFCKYITLRLGKFLMPIGRFNEYLYPEYINIFIDRPNSHWNIIPSVWSEVGAELRGNISITNSMSVNYAVFAVNGLEQKDGKYGGSIREMRENYLDDNNNGKSFGGRIGLKPASAAEMGVSYYTGAYSVDGSKKLSIVCLDAEYKYKNIGIRGEYTQSVQDTLNGNITNRGFFLESSYRINKYFEPALRFDQANLPGLTGMKDINGDGFKDFNTETFQRISFGLIFYPEPELLSRFNFKINYCIIPNDGQGTKRNEFAIQAAIGF